jgi:hypothetical protein
MEIQPLHRLSLKIINDLGKTRLPDELLAINNGDAGKKEPFTGWKEPYP